MPREIFIGSLTTQPGEGLSLTRLLKAQAIRGQIKEIHAVLTHQKVEQNTLEHLVALAFGFAIIPGDIPRDNSSIEEIDHIFAQEFGYIILPISCARLTGGRVEAWISPAFVSKEHPLARLKKDNAVVITTGKDNQKTTSHYVRLTVKNDAGVLAKIADQFGSANISIRMAKQPEVEEDSKTAQLAFVLHPCETEALEECVTSIQDLDVCLGVGSVLRVVE